MLRIVANSILASEVAEFLDKELHGENIVIYGPSTLDKITDHSMICLNNNESLPEEICKKMEVLILSPRDLGPTAPASFIVTPEPEVDFVQVINNYFARLVVHSIHPMAVIEQGAVVGRNVGIGAGSFIGPEVEIGDQTIIFQNVAITGKVKIGNQCVIKANSTIGSDIFDFVYTDNQWEQFPQIGKILIGNNVWIGANTTIEKGSLSDTVIDNGVKIDDLVQIGSSSFIGQNSMIAAGAVICREVKIGQKCWIAPNVSILERLKIGDYATIGLGGVVIDDVTPSTVVAGNPAQIIKKKF